MAFRSYKSRATYIDALQTCKKEEDLQDEKCQFFWGSLCSSESVDPSHDVSAHQSNSPVAANYTEKMFPRHVRQGKDMPVLSTKDVEGRVESTFARCSDRSDRSKLVCFPFFWCYLAYYIALCMLISFRSAWNSSLKLGDGLLLLSRQLLPSYQRESSLLVGYVETGLIIVQCAIWGLTILTAASTAWYVQPEWAEFNWDGQFWNFHDWMKRIKTAISGWKETSKTAILGMKENIRTAV